MATNDEEQQPSDYDEQPVDASKELARMEKEALHVLFPDPEEMAERINLITHLRGKPPDIYVLYLAAVEYEGWLSLEEGRPIDWKKLDPTKFFMMTAPSIQRRGRQEAVEIARATPPADRKRSIFDLIRGK